MPGKGANPTTCAGLEQGFRLNQTKPSRASRDDAHLVFEAELGEGEGALLQKRRVRPLANLGVLLGDRDGEGPGHSPESLASCAGGKR